MPEIPQITHMYCEKSGGKPGEDSTTHHLVAIGATGEQKCRYCKKTPAEIRTVYVRTSGEKPQGLEAQAAAVRAY